MQARNDGRRHRGTANWTSNPISAKVRVMKRGSFYLIAAALLCLAAIGWLQKKKSMPQEWSTEGSDPTRIPSRSSAATRTPLATPREFTPPSRRAWRQPSKVPGPAQRLGLEPGDSPGEAADGNPVPVAARREGGGQEPEGAQPGDLNQPGTPPPADDRESLLKNGSFEEGLEFWGGTQCEVIPEPGRKENSVLEVSLDGDGFQLEQAFRGPAEMRDLTLSFRVKNPKATKKLPLGIDLEMSDAEGRLLITSILTAEISEDWSTSSVRVPGNETHRPPAASIRFKKKGEEGKLWIDDVTLK
jgi:hypothetical protein